MNSFIVHTLLIRRWRRGLLVVAPPGAEEGDDTSGHTGEQGQHKTPNSNSRYDTCMVIHESSSKFAQCKRSWTVSYSFTVVNDAKFSYSKTLCVLRPN